MDARPDRRDSGREIETNWPRQAEGSCTCRQQVCLLQTRASSTSTAARWLNMRLLLDAMPDSLMLFTLLATGASVEARYY